MLGRHLLVLHEGGELGVRHADGFQQQRIGRNVDRLHVGEGGEHHAHFNRFEERHVVFHVVRADFHIRLGKEAEDLREQIALLVGQLGRPVLAVLAQRHLFGQPVHLGLDLPEIIRPRIAERLVGQAGSQQARAVGSDGKHGVSFSALRIQIEGLGARSTRQIAPQPLRSTTYCVAMSLVSSVLIRLSTREET